MTSLRRILLAWLLVPLVLIVSGGATLQYWLTVRPATEALDVALADAALAVGNLLRVSGGRLEVALNEDTERLLRADRYDSVYYAVLGPQGALAAGDRSLAELDLGLAPPRQTVYLDDTLEGQPVRIVVLGLRCGTGTCQVRVAETWGKRERIQRNALMAATATLALLIFAVTVATAAGVRRGLRPLARLRNEVGQRSLEDLQELDAHGAPTEVQPLLGAINQLFTRLRTASVAQKSFIADAAHQLRTPLASLRTESELALLEPHPAEMRPTLGRIANAAARAARLAEQLLALARADSTAQADTPAEWLDLRQLVTESAQEWVPRAIGAGIDLGFELHAATALGRGFLLRELLANLVHNAFQYAGRGARVTVRTRSEPGASVLEVEDNGPGIAPAERDRLFERFTRGHGAHGTGSGLGLAIVRDIAQLHGAEITLDHAEAGTGLRVRVRFPARAP